MYINFEGLICFSRNRYWFVEPISYHYIFQTWFKWFLEIFSNKSVRNRVIIDSDNEQVNREVIPQTPLKSFFPSSCPKSDSIKLTHQCQWLGLLYSQGYLVFLFSEKLNLRDIKFKIKAFAFYKTACFPRSHYVVHWKTIISHIEISYIVFHV